MPIYRGGFQPSETLEKPYTIAGVDVIVADTDEQEQRLFTSLIRMFYGVLGKNGQPEHQFPVFIDHYNLIIKNVFN